MFADCTAHRVGRSWISVVVAHQRSCSGNVSAGVMCDTLMGFLISLAPFHHSGSCTAGSDFQNQLLLIGMDERSLLHDKLVPLLGKAGDDVFWCCLFGFLMVQHVCVLLCQVFSLLGNRLDDQVTNQSSSNGYGMLWRVSNMAESNDG